MSSQGVFFASLSGALYGTLGLFGVYLKQEGLSIIDFSFWRFFVAIIILLPFAMGGQQKWPLNRSGLITFLSGLLFYSVATSVYFEATADIGSGLAMVLFFLYPIPLIFFEWFFDKKRPTVATIFALGVILIGLVFLADLSFDLKKIYGIGIGLLCAFFFAIYFYLSQKHVQKMSLTMGTFLICLGNFVGFMFAVFFFQEGQLQLPTTPLSYLFVFGIAAISTVCPIFLIYRSLETIPASLASILSVFEPIVTLLLGWCFLNESISYWQFLGVVLILFSALFLQQVHKRKEKSSKQLSCVQSA